MPKPTVYVETTVIGHLVGRIAADLSVAGRQFVTREWWATCAADYELFVSRLVIEECSAGESVPAAERLESIRELGILEPTEEAEKLAELLIAGGAIPATEPRDAAHVSLAAVHRIKYLVTWNFKHIVNPSTRATIERVCLEAGYVPPLICTPDELAEE